LDVKFLGYPKNLLRGFSVSGASGIVPSLGFKPCLFTRDDWMCLAGEGGGNGRLNSRRGVLEGEFP
jgi:hypothetical protein